MTHNLKLMLLGTPRIERDNALVRMDTRKAIALLAYIVVTGQPDSRDSLAALLWPEHDQSSARGALRRTPSTLNLYRGDFMDGFSLRDSSSFDDWQFIRSATSVLPKRPLIVRIGVTKYRQ